MKDKWIQLLNRKEKNKSCKATDCGSDMIRVVKDDDIVSFGFVNCSANQ